MSSNDSLSTADMRNFTHAALYYIEQASYLAADSELSRQTEGMELKKTVFCTGFYALFTALAAAAALILIKQRKTSHLNATVLLGAICVLYVATTVYWILLLWVTMSDYGDLIYPVQRIQSLLNNTVDCIETGVEYSGATPQCNTSVLDLGGNFTSASESIAYNAKPDHKFVAQECANLAALTTNVAIGDAIVWWRAIVVWQRNRVVYGLAIVVVGATFVLGAGGATLACLPKVAQHDISLSQKYRIFINSEAIFGATVQIGGFAGSCLSLATNLTATSLIGYQAWAHRQLVKDHLRAGSRRTRVENLLFLLVESGVIYCILWVIVAVYLGLASIFYRNGSPRFLQVFDLLVQGALVPIIGIYPTAIMVICALKKSLNDSTQISLRIPTLNSIPQDPEQVHDIDLTGAGVARARADELGGVEEPYSYTETRISLGFGDDHDVAPAGVNGEPVVSP